MRAVAALLALVLTQPVSASLVAQVPTWPVTAKPVTVIGIADGTPEQELVNVTWARRLADGRVMVSNGKPLDVRVYDARGHFLNHIGRKGQGPGEFGGAPALLPAAGDSVALFDGDSRRLMVFHVTGKLGHQTMVESKATFDGAAIFAHRALLFSLAQAEYGCARQLLARLPDLAPPLIRIIHSDGAGRFWVNDGAGNSWTVYSSNGTAVGRVSLPKGFRLMQAGAGHVVGRQLDADDVEQVVVFAVPASVHAQAPCRLPGGPFLDVHSDRATALTKVLRDAMTGGEMAYSNYATYVASPDSMGDFKTKIPSDIVFTGFMPSNRGWGAMAFDRKSRLACAFAVNLAALPGMPDGGFVCRD